MADTPQTLDVHSLRGPRVVLRRVADTDIPQLDAIAREPGVARWWPLPAGESIAYDLCHPDEVSFVIEVDDAVAGAVMFGEEKAPLYRSAGIDIMLSSAYQGLGLGPEALRVLIRYLIDERGHHRITIDPAAANEHAISAYGKVGFKPVGIMREYEASADGVFHDNLLMDLLAREFADK